MQETTTATTTSLKSNHTSTRWSRYWVAIRPWIQALAPLATFLAILAFWQTIVMLEIYPRFIIPAPIEVLEKFLRVLDDGTLLKHAWVTMQETLLGLLIGAGLGTLLGYLIAKSKLLEDLLAPIIVALQSTPIVAYAPLLIIWFGSGRTSKIITCAVIVFFPMLMNTSVGIRTVPANLRDLMRSLSASRWQMFITLDVPAALPIMLTGLKTSATLAVIGAVVGEFLNASEGLGFLVIRARSEFDTALVLVGVMTMTALALSLFTFVSSLEWMLLGWQRRSGN